MAIWSLSLPLAQAHDGRPGLTAVVGWTLANISVAGMQSKAQASPGDFQQTTEKVLPAIEMAGAVFLFTFAGAVRMVG